MSEKQEARRLLPFRLRLPLPTLTVPRFGRSRKVTKFASASVAIGECTVVTPTHAPLLSAPPKAATKPASDVVAGALARAASQSTIHPLDTLKVRLQAGCHAAAKATPKPAAASAAALRGGGAGGSVAPWSLSKYGQLVPPLGGARGGLVPGGGAALLSMGQGVASLYSGVVGAASGAGIAIGAYFAFYGLASNALATHTQLKGGTAAFCAGGLAAAGSSVVKVPLAVCIRSVQAGVYPNVFAAARAITGAAGVRGLFTGYAPTLLEDVPDMAFKFAAYETLRSVHSKVTHGTASPQADFAMGAVSGALAAAATTPLDVVKTNMMCAAASRPSVASAAARVYATAGFSGFFAGVGTRALSNGINSAVFFCFFEAIRGNIAARARAAQAQAVPCSSLSAPSAAPASKWRDSHDDEEDAVVPSRDLASGAPQLTLTETDTE